MKVRLGKKCFFKFFLDENQNINLVQFIRRTINIKNIENNISLMLVAQRFSLNRSVFQTNDSKKKFWLIFPNSNFFEVLKSVMKSNFLTNLNLIDDFNFDVPKFAAIKKKKIKFGSHCRIESVVPQHLDLQFSEASESFVNFVRCNVPSIKFCA